MFQSHVWAWLATIDRLRRLLRGEYGFYHGSSDWWVVVHCEHATRDPVASQGESLVYWHSNGAGIDTSLAVSLLSTIVSLLLRNNGSRPPLVVETETFDAVGARFDSARYLGPVFFDKVKG